MNFGDEKKGNTLEENKEGEIFEKLINYFIAQEEKLMSSLSDENTDQDKVKTNILKVAKEKLKFFCDKDVTLQKTLLKKFENYMWGYYILEPLINDPDIFDITTYSYDRIRAERLGEWEDGKIQFSDKKFYEQYIRMICTRNKCNLSFANAQIKFTDAISDDNYILRFNISAGRLNSSGNTEMHIRKIPKKKFLMDDLVKRKYMTRAQCEFIKKYARDGHNIFLSGSNGSGKTIGLNAILEELPLGKSGIIIQESDELFTDNPDFLAQHVHHDNGEGKIIYGLKELANVALMDARDIFVLGEVKSGADAASLPMMTATGSQVLFTGHGNNERESIYKIADYVKQETGYELDQCLRFLTNFLVVHCKKFKVTGMSIIKEWNYKKNKLDIIRLDSECKLVTEEELEKPDIFQDINSYILNEKGIV